MRIAIDARPLQHPHTGIGRYTLQLTNRLQDMGCEFIHCHAHGGRFAQTLQAQTQFAALAKATNADLFWSPRHHLPIGLKIPSVVTVHDLVFRFMPETMPAIRRWTDTILTKRSLKSATRIIAVSANTEAEILSIDSSAATRIDVIYEASSLPDSTATVSPYNAPYVLLVATLEPRKNIERAVSAFLSCNYEDVLLVIVGNDGWGNVTVPDHENIIHLTHVTDEALADLYRHTVFLLAPSLHEGFGLQICEALQFGKAIVTSQAGALAEVAGRAAIYVDPLSTADISSKIELLLRNRPLRDELEAHAIQRRKLFSWEEAAIKTLEVFNIAAGRLTNESTS